MRPVFYFRSLLILAALLSPSVGQTGWFDVCVSQRIRNGLDLPLRLPADWSSSDQSALIGHFEQDGRPILLITDAAKPQVNGVVNTLTKMEEKVQTMTHGKVKIVTVTPDQFPQAPFSYQDIRPAFMSQKKFEQIFREMNPQAVHIAVEGPLGLAARQYCNEHNIPYTTGYHTSFPEYAGGMAAKFHQKIGNVVESTFWKFLRKFHGNSEGIMVPTESVAQSLIAHGFKPSQIRYWSRGVDIERFDPEKADRKVFEPFNNNKPLTGPISLYVGRVAPEKNIEDFLKMKVPGTKVVVGGGPDLEQLKKNYPDVIFMGKRDQKTELPTIYASADVFVFPSVTDTFGNVQLEALASGTPVAAYNVTGPKDLLTPAVGALATYEKKKGDQNVEALTAAWHDAITKNRQTARTFAESRPWESSATEFLYFLRPLPPRPKDANP